MTSFRSNRLFLLLMTLAVAAAAFLPNRVSDRGRAHLQVLFAPVALPTRWVAGAAHAMIWPARTRDEGSPDGRPRGDETVLAENQRLHVELANMRGLLEHYRVLVGEREQLGALRDRCVRFPVMGVDAGNRRSISLVGRGAGQVRVGMPALAPAGVIGRVERVGVGSATVLLLSDRQSVITCGFGRGVTEDDGRPRFEMLKLPPTLVTGTGGATLVSDKLSRKDVEAAGLLVGDRVVLDDAAWPDDLRGYPVGRVSRIEPSSANVLFARIEIEPVVDATQLRDVMILAR